MGNKISKRRESSPSKKSVVHPLSLREKSPSKSLYLAKKSGFNFTNAVFGGKKNKKKPKKTTKPKLEPIPIKGRVNPQDHEDIPSNSLDFQINEGLGLKKVMRVLMPSSRYKDYRIIKMKKYCEDKVIYSVRDEQNHEKRLYQYKFYETSEINVKCKTLSFISKLELGRFPLLEDLFIDLEEVDFRSFYYLNIICAPQRTICLSEIMKILLRKQKGKIEEQLLWDIFKSLLNSINFAAQNKIILQNFNLMNCYLIMPKKKRGEEKAFVLANLIKVLGKGFRNNCQIILFNKVSAPRKKERMFASRYLKKLINTKPFYFDFICFRDITSNSEQFICGFYREITRFFLNILAIICKTSFEELTSKGSSYISLNIDKLEYTPYLKFFLKRLLVFQHSLPICLKHVNLTLEQCLAEFNVTAASSKSLFQQPFEKSIDKMRVEPDFLYYIHKEFLVFSELKTGNPNLPNIVIIDMKPLIPKELEGLDVISCCWDQDGAMYLVYNSLKHSNKLFVFEFDLLDVRSRIEDQPITKLDISKKENYKFMEFVNMKQSFSICELCFDQQGYLRMTGFENEKRKVQFYAIGNKSKEVVLIKEVSLSSSKAKIIDFWFKDQEIWFWKRVDLQNFEKDLLEIHNIEKNTITTLEIDAETYRNLLFINQTQKLQSLRFVSRPIVFHDAEKVVLFVELKTRVVGLEGGLNGLEGARIINAGEGINKIPKFGITNNYLFSNQKNFYTLSLENDGISLEFYEIDLRNLSFYFENTAQLLSFKDSMHKESNNFMDKFHFEKYKLIKHSEFNEVYEIQEEITGKNILIFKKEEFLKADKLNTSLKYHCFEDTKFFFDIIFKPCIRKFVYLPEDFLFSANVTKHSFELWLFLEKSEKSLYEYLYEFKDSRSYDTLLIFRLILKTFFKIQEFGLLISQNFTLEDIFLFQNRLKNKISFKFDLMSFEEKKVLDSDFHYFIEFQRGKSVKSTKTNVSSIFLAQIPNQNLEKFGFLLFFIYFPRYLTHLELESQEIIRFLSKIKQTSLKNYSIEVIELIEELINAKTTIVFPNGLTELIERIKLMIKLRPKDEIQQVLKNENIFCEDKPQKLIYMVERGMIPLFKYNLFSHELRKLRVFFPDHTRYDLGKVVISCFNYEKNLFFGLGTDPSQNQLVLFMVDVSKENLDYCIEVMPKNPRNPYENQKDFEPSGLVCLREHVYQIGGILKFYQRLQGCPDCFSFHYPSKTWSTIRPLNIPRINPGILATNMYIFVFGGEVIEGPKFQLCVERYHPEENRWQIFIVRDLQRESFDCFYSGFKFLAALDSQKTLMVVNLQMNKSVILSFGSSLELYESTIAEPFEVLACLKERNLMKSENQWFSSHMIVMNRKAQLSFIDNGHIFLLSMKEEEDQFRIKWDQEVLVWNLTN